MPARHVGDPLPVRGDGRREVARRAAGQANDTRRLGRPQRWGRRGSRPAPGADADCGDQQGGAEGPRRRHAPARRHRRRRALVRPRLGQVGAGIADVAQPRRHVLLEAPADHAPHRWRDRGGQRLPRRLALQHRGHGVRRRAPRERPRAGEHLVEEAAERPDVGTAIDQLASCLLRAHVGGRAENQAGLGDRRARDGGRAFGIAGRIQRLGNPEVQHLDLAVWRDLDVGGLEVAVHDAALVGEVDGFRDLARDGQCPGHGNRPPCEHRCERLALDEFEDERWWHSKARGLHAIDGTDVRMVQGRQDTGFTREAGQALGVGRERGGQRLDGDVAAEEGIAGAVHLAHAALAQRGQDLVRADSSAGGEGHRRAVILQDRRSCRGVEPMGQQRGSGSRMTRDPDRAGLP